MGTNSGFFVWSQTPSSNASADATINYREGQAPSTLNDSARALMARLREWGNDIAGAIVTSGTSTGYTVSSNQSFDTLAHLNGQVIAFSPHTTNAAGPVTLNVDGLGNKALRSAPNVELLAGTLIQGTPYVAVYNNTDGAFYLQGFYGNPYNVPLGSSLEFWGSAAPNSSFAFPYGQAISRTTYATLFALLGTTYGTGDGSTTFNLPDVRGRVVAGKDDMGGTAASRLTSAGSSIAGATLGATGGAETETLTAAQLPTITSSGNLSSNTDVPVSASTGFGIQVFSTGTGGSTGWKAFSSGSDVANGTVTGTVSSTSNDTLGYAHVNVQPTIVANRILRII